MSDAKFNPRHATELWMCECKDWVLSIGHADAISCRECGKAMSMIHRTQHDPNAIVLSEFEMNGFIARLAEEMRQELPSCICCKPMRVPPQWEMYEKLMYIFYTSQSKNFKLIDINDIELSPEGR